MKYECGQASWLIALVFAHFFPASAQGLVEGDQIGGDGSLALGEQSSKEKRDRWASKFECPKKMYLFDSN
jgi:hypothetical protein